MNKDSKEKTSSGRNEGEGNKTAARQYDEAQHRFAQSGKVEEKAQEAKRAREGGERDELDRAEAVGRSHIAEEDPKVTRSSGKGEKGKH